MKTFLLRACLLASLFLTTHLLQAQYADGTGTGLHQNQIFWLQWGGPSLTTVPAGFTSTNIVAGTYIWDLEPGLTRVVGQLSNIGTVTPPTNGATLSLAPYNSGTWTGNGTTSLGDGLQIMYPGTNPIGIATSLNGGAVPSSVFRGVIKFDIALNLQMLINGVWTDLNYPGMIVADAESMNATSAVTEYISATTSGSTGWQILDVRNNAASIGQDPTKYKLEIGNSGAYFKLCNDQVNDMGVQAVMYAQGTKALTDVQMKGRGVTALALGFIAPFDYGDAPASYGDAIHYMDDLTLNSTPITANGTYSVTSQAIATLVTPSANVYIDGLPDADGGLVHNSPNADIDEAVTLPDYNGSGTYTLTVPVTNNSGSSSHTGAWIDWNNNGAFDASEGILQTLPASATSATFTWTGLTTNPIPGINYFVRVRITTDELTSPTGGSTDGEVEDHFLRAVYSLSGNVFDDGDGLTDNTVDGTGTNVGGVLYANLVDNTGTVVATTPVAGNGTYGFFGALSGNYTVQLSTNQGTVGLASPAVALPAGWVSTGENSGAGAGNDGAVNAILPVSVTAGVVVTDLNFGIEQLPVANDQSYIIAAPAVNGVLTLNGTGATSSPGPLSGADPEDGTLGAAGTVIITDLDAMNGNELYYDGTLVTVGAAISNYNPDLLSIKFTGPGSLNASFDYAFTDAASKTGTPGTYKVSWTTPLPVTLVDFTVTTEGPTALLAWATTEETNSDRFEIERSFDSKTWEQIGAVKSTGESKTLIRYDFVDSNPSGNGLSRGENLYRLRMVDNDGTFAYSRIRSVRFESGENMIVYPNPAFDRLFLKDFTKAINIRIVDMNGQAVYQSQKPASGEINLGNLTTGMHIVEITWSGGSKTTRKILVRK